MDFSVMISMLYHQLERTAPSARRHILRIACRKQFQILWKAIRKQQRKSSKRIWASVVPLPLVQAFAFPGQPNPQLMSRFTNLLSVEEDVKVLVHAVPQGTAPPHIPEGIRSIGVPSIWPQSLGEHIKIGIIDTGVDYHHPDLQSVLSRGINFVNPHTLPYDDNGHGTHIAGTIAASGRNGMKGIAPRSVLLPVKAFDHNGSAYVSDIIRGIDWCVHQGVDIINMSFGMRKRSASMLQAVRNASRSGVLIVASSGNDGKRNFIDYPARYLQTISVGAVDRKGRVAPFSNQGRRIDIYAPGERIMSTWPHRKYQEMSGTSMATSHVTGVIALLLAKRPRVSPQAIKRILSAAQRPVRGNKQKALEPGRIDAVKAFRRWRLESHALRRRNSN